MPHYSATSRKRLDSCHPDLIRLFEAVLPGRDHSILEGHRSPERQAKLLASGASRVRVSKHNAYPSLAVDVAPYVPGKNAVMTQRACAYFAGYVMRVAEGLGIRIRWGGDWDGDKDVHDQTFNDLVHFELIEEGS